MTVEEKGHLSETCPLNTVVGTQSHATTPKSSSWFAAT